MILIVGLGNPGEKYAYNRHNAGFMFVDYLAKRVADSEERIDKFTYDKYSHSDIIKCDLSATRNPRPAILAKPQTFMNRSGEAVKNITTRYSQSTTRLFVAHDDLDLELGKFKIQQGVGPKMHNGISSIEDALGTKDFWRIRIGVDSRAGDRSMPGEAYVLQDFSNEETTILTNIFPQIYDTFISNVRTK